MSLHNAQKLDDDLGGGADQDLPLAPPFSINDVVLLSSGLSTLEVYRSQNRTNKAVILREYVLNLVKPQKPERDEPKRIREPYLVGGQGVGRRL